MKVAILHYWLVGMRGGEKVLEEISALYPDADIYTHVLNRAKLSPGLAARDIRTTSIARLPAARRAYKAYFGLMPGALERLDMSGYDLIIASESGPAQGVIAPPGTRTLTYCHSPMRYIWDQRETYAAALPAPARPVFRHVAGRMRAADFAAAQRVDRIIANSSFIASRIRRYWGREAEVLCPPIDLDRFGATPDAPREGYLFVSELTGYKRADLVVEAFSGTNRQVTIIGDGPERARLERTAPPNVRFAGRLPDAELAAAYQAARALIFPAEEDFGLVPVEAMAAGTPVIAYGRGGVLDSVVPGLTGLFFDRQSPEAIRAALDRFEASETPFAHACRARAAKFGRDQFRGRFRAAVDALMAAPPSEQRQ
ncbi:MAG: glycosyltransferase [Pseudomonadota bacterium]